MPENHDRDPVVFSSLSAYLLIASLLLTVSLGLALYNEFFGLRPWKDYQRQFKSRYAHFLEKEIPRQAAAEKAILGSAEYQDLQKKLKDAEEAARPNLNEIDSQVARIDQRLAGVTTEFTDKRAYVSSAIYIIERTSGERSRKRREENLEKFRKGPFRLRLPALDASGKIEDVSFTYDQLEEEFNRLREQKSNLLTQKVEVLRPVTELRHQAQTYVQDHLNGLGADQLKGLLKKTRSLSIEIKQIHNPDAHLVERCESCHLAIREPVVVTRQDMGGVKDRMAAAFTSHPSPELLQIHNPEKFGCTPCHNGNGMQVVSVQKAHGNYEHWLWPLYPRANFEAGCQQCHASDMVVDHAPMLSRGKELFQWRGCMGCHRFQGYDAETEDVTAVQQQIAQLEMKRQETQREIRAAIQLGDQAADNETARSFYQRAEALRVSTGDIDGRIEQLDYRARNLLQDIKKVGPSLKEVRVKLRAEWVPVWITNPHDFRPTTRMPRFRLDEDEVKSVAAFIWQSGVEGKLPVQPRGDAARGKESFETRGCLGCHSIGEGDNRTGGTFAANLTRVGEKVNYDYLVRWVHDPRERTRPYCPFEKRDLTEDDYKKHGKPFVFDPEHSECPNDGHELQVEQMTVMPSLRLSIQEARDIATYLMTQKEKDLASYPAAPYLSDVALKAEGLKVVQRYGCAGCHEIAGLETEGRIGTELTKEGSKPLEQFDFALLVTEAREQGWHSHKGFFEHKLQKPEMFDQGLIKAEGEELKMPNFNLKPEDITALTTFLMGAVDSTVPRQYQYLPSDQRRDVQEGWWLIKKYNCMGCHQFKVGQATGLEVLARFQTPEGKDQLPPKLLGEGARVSPDWLLRFLTNPALSKNDTDRNGIRPYLKTRMPTFYFSPNEVRKLVRFFQAMSSQPMPYIPPRLDPLTNQELTLARALFTSRAAPCLKCHATGDAGHDRYATAPNFLFAPERLKPGWTKRWLLDPSMISPGTAMPSGLFKRDGARWVFAGPTPPIFAGYEGDQADLLVRYMFAMTAEEQRRLVGMSAGAMKSAASVSRSDESHARLQVPAGQLLSQAH
ncbi:MAG: c-type cytochrome [Acidobacteria bacterium]|nr:c-type cytochrome [Acidobacteriota bacterium]